MWAAPARPVCPPQVSGLSPWIGQQLTATFGTFAPWQLTFVVTCIVAMATEIISNGATASRLLPILGLQVCVCVCVCFRKTRTVTNQTLFFSYSFISSHTYSPHPADSFFISQYRPDVDRQSNQTKATRLVNTIYVHEVGIVFIAESCLMPNHGGLHGLH